MKSILKKLLLGVIHPQEYICAQAGEIHDALDCFALVNGNKIPVTDGLHFLGYRPLIMGWITEKFEDKDLILLFERKDNGKLIASMTLQLEQKFPLEKNDNILKRIIYKKTKKDSRRSKY